MTAPAKTGLQSQTSMGTWRTRLGRLLRRLALATGLGLLASVLLVAALYAYYSRDLPSVAELKTWRPPQVTKVTCRNGQVCAEFFIERRTWVDVKALPKHVGLSFLAAEDANFYEHGGLDYLGMARSAVKNLKPGGLKSGASTISQQACRWLLLSSERTFARKAREWILTPRMEETLTKDEILNLYVNSIYFGHGRYGIEEAALFYFGKHANALSIGEAAVLAGTVQAPHRINPVTNIVRAKKRQRYVLGQLSEKGFIVGPEVQAALEAPIVLGPRPPAPVGQYYAEDVRKQLVERYGDAKVQQGGMRVEVAMDPKLQAFAEQSVREGLEAVDRRQGYRGPVGTIELTRFERLRPLLEKRLAEAGRRRPEDVLLADLTTLRETTPPPQELGADVRFDPETVVDPDEAALSDDERQVRNVEQKVATEGVESVGVVTQVETNKAEVDLIGIKGRLEFKASNWARRRVDNKVQQAPSGMGDIVAVGDLVRVRVGVALPASTLRELTLVQVPKVQGALVVIEPQDRAVLAMVGGYDFSTSEFNRATQAKRQPGSSFKPFLYAAAIASGRFTALTQVNDAPEAIRDPWTNKLWKPQNFERGAFEGPITLRTGLTKSKNTISVRLIEALGPEAVIDFARKAGIHSELPNNLTLALGTGEVTVLEEANAYTTLRADGAYADPVTIVRVRDGSGRTLEEYKAMPEQAFSPAVAAVTTSLMRSVVEEGTATAVRELTRPAAGKTGTAQEYRDAWFSGYTMDFVAAAWVGFDDHTPIGPLETGGKAALPIWLAFMKRAHQGLPVREFELPEGVVQVRVDPASGKLAGRAIPGRLETFVAGTEPKEDTLAPGAVDPNDFLWRDSKR